MAYVGDGINLIEDFSKNLKEANDIHVSLVKNKDKFEKAIIIGMGGCYCSGLILRDLFIDELKIPIDVYSEPILKNQVNSKTLIVLLSYSGNSKEIIESYSNLKKYKKNIIILSSGGNISKIAKKSLLIKLPKNKHQRFTFEYTTIPLIRLFEKLNLIPKFKDLNKIIKIIDKNKEKINSESRRIVLKIREKIPLVYSTNRFYSLAYRFQTCIEEDTKTICHSNKITELFHNEIEALPDKRFFTIIILDKEELKKNQNQINFFKEYIKNYYEIGFNKYPRKIRIFLIVYLINLISYHLSLLKEIDKNLIHKTLISDKIKDIE